MVLRVIATGLCLAASSCSALPGFGPERPLFPTVWVYKSSGAIQCRTSGVPLDVMQRELAVEDVEVFASCRTGDGMLHSAVCGASAGLVNAYEIDQRDLPKAITLGFAELSKSPGHKGKSLQQILGEECFQRT